MSSNVNGSSAKAYVPGLEGVVVGETAISHVEGDIGRLSYRGHVIEDVVKMQYLEAAYLVLFGERPDSDALSLFESYLSEHGDLTADEKILIGSMPSKIHPMKALQAVIPVLSFSENTYRNTDRDTSIGLQIIAKYPSIIAAIRALRSELADPDRYGEERDYLSRFIVMFAGEIPSAEEMNVLRTVQLLQMDHSFNAGTFASRVIGSTMAPVTAVLSGAVGALSGVLHGGADEAALIAAREVGSPEGAEAFVDALLARKGRLMGMGHREYRTVDPRSVILKPMAAELCLGTPFENDFLTLIRIEEVFNERMNQRGKSVWANVEYYKGVVLEVLGIEPPYFTTMFAMARTVGWLAHLMESRVDNRIIRPAAQYVGPVVSPVGGRF